ncbi:nucleic acid/nucleotide deaminase domain-containing protein [Streptomyces sp. NPDC056528]|uniref:WXG100-like domain-containing protein n=1 Tax=Streptomyces sp. NPDC056528 TaxID=3345854 RepID=UPI0036CECE43
MGKTLPDDLVGVLDLVGVSWPNIDEDEVRSNATDYRNLAEGVRNVITQGNQACSHIVSGKSKGQTVQAIDRRWGKLTTKDLKTFSNALDSLADALDDCAGFIEGCKIACITDLSIAAGTATAGVVGMFFTLGTSAAVSALAIAACRIALHEAIDYAIGEITKVVTERIEAKILSQIEGLFTDALDAHDDGNLGQYGFGSADMATDLAIEFDDFDKASGDYGKTKDDFDKQKTLHKTGGSKRRGSVSKDSRFHKLATVMDKAEEAVDKKADETVTVLEKHGADIEAAKKEHKKSDKKAKDDIDGCKDVRTYLLDADGTVRRLEANGDLKNLDATDKDRLDGILNDGKVWRPSTRADREEHSVGDTHTGKVKTDKVDPYTDKLGHATQLARYARNDYTENNYAAGRYVDPDGKGESILVGYSKTSLHSERSIGYPLLRNGKQQGLTKVFSERAPCQKRPRCEAWLNKHFPKVGIVDYANEYDQSVSRNKRDIEHQDYMKELKARHGR